MGRHGKQPDNSEFSYNGDGTPMGVGTPIPAEEAQRKAEQFDASLADPRGYALENFQGANPSAEAWAAQRAQQIADLAALRDQK